VTSTPSSPDELRATLPHSLRGYDPAAVDRLLEQFAATSESLRKERAELEGRVGRLEAELAEHREIQGLMRDALVSAQRAADELTERTRRECDELLAQARAEADATREESRRERERTEAEIRRLKAAEQEIRASYKVLLHAALDRLDEPLEEEAPKPSLLDALAPDRVTKQSKASKSSD
jgi:cell division initiation protein